MSQDNPVMADVSFRAKSTTFRTERALMVYLHSLARSGHLTIIVHYLVRGCVVRYRSDLPKIGGTDLLSVS